MPPCAGLNSGSWLAEMSLDEREAHQHAERDTMQHLSRLEHKAVKCRQHPSVRSAPESATHMLGINNYQSSDLPEIHLDQEEHILSSSAPAHMMSHLPPVRTSIPSAMKKQVRTTTCDRISPRIHPETVLNFARSYCRPLQAANIALDMLLTQFPVGWCLSQALDPGKGPLDLV